MKRKTIARQAGFDLGSEPFALVTETAIDGARVTQLRSEIEQRRAEFAAAQLDLVPVNQNQTP